MPSSISISFWLTNDCEMRKLNKSVFKKGGTTDVISFNIDETLPDQSHQYLGEIVVNQDTVKRNADKYKVAYEQELARVVAHGVLHLLGYEDDTPDHQRAMRAIEDSVVKDFVKT